jgi:hypothetical protein
MSFPKHEWLRAVARDKGLDDSYARVAMDLSTSTSVDDGTFCVRQKTVAERMGRDVRSVKRAYAALKIAGYIEWVAAGKRGRGYLSGDTWRLRFPQVGSGDDCVTTSVSGDDSSPEVVTRGAISGDDSSPEVVTTQAADLPSASENGVPVVLNEGLYEGLEGGAAPDEPESLDAEAVPDSANAHPPQNQSANRIDPADAWVDAELVDDHHDPEPPLYCKRHMPDGTDDSCPACGNRRRVHERWERRQPVDSKLRAWAALALEARELESRQVAVTAGAAAPERDVAEAAHGSATREPPSWVPGPDGRPRCRRHGHLPTAPADCTQCHDVAMAAGESA